MKSIILVFPLHEMRLTVLNEFAKRHKEKLRVIFRMHSRADQEYLVRQPGDAGISDEEFESLREELDSLLCDSAQTKIANTRQFTSETCP